jgi:diguanylate cyclase (GGDEF)-like protein
MTYQASHDALTGLINRREFERRLEHALQTAQQEDKQHTLLYLDLDQFKIVNDTCGHIAGDELLRQLTTVMHADLRSNDTLARLGGDEFGLLLENCASGTALRVAELLRQTVHEFRFVWQDRVFTVGASIGLVTFSDAKETLGDILRKADAACYLAKDKGAIAYKSIGQTTPDLHNVMARWDGSVEYRRRWKNSGSCCMPSKYCH